MTKIILQFLLSVNLYAIVSQAKEKPQYAEVVEVGPGAVVDGELIGAGVGLGDDLEAAAVCIPQVAVVAAGDDLARLLHPSAAVELAHPAGEREHVLVDRAPRGVAHSLRARVRRVEHLPGF